MSDFYLDFRPREKRANIQEISERIRYFNDIAITIVEKESFSLCITHFGAQELWGIYENNANEMLAAVSGRIAADEQQWEEARTIKGNGGLCAKIAYQHYMERGTDGLTSLNGGFVALIHDGQKNVFFMVTDRAGAHPCFCHSTHPVFCSHPDILALATGESNAIDYVSIAEFLKTGKLSPPATYYTHIKALDEGTVYAIDTHTGRNPVIGKQRYFHFIFKTEHSRSEWDIAAELKDSFQKAISIRTLPHIGQTAVSLSGGLDSRAIAGALPDPSRIWSFSFFDKENREFSIARKVAAATGMRNIPLQRDYDHYGNHAEAGIKIAGGMGDFGSNHYLGFRDRFIREGIDNIITGFYCDYLFKGLVLDAIENKWLRRKRLSDFKLESYMPIFTLGTEYDDHVNARLNELFPPSLRTDGSPAARLEIERRRIFPFFYEPDNLEALVPQRTLGWYLPTADNHLLDTYLKIPPSMKLNISMYSKMVFLMCGKKLSSIENINTGARVNASLPEIMILNNLGALRRKISKRRKAGIATEDSWPNWRYYIVHSECIRHLWRTPQEGIRDIFKKVLGNDPLTMELEYFQNNEVKLLLRLLTIKLWFEKRFV